MNNNNVTRYISCWQGRFRLITLLCIGLIVPFNNSHAATNAVGIGINSLSYWDGSHAMADLQAHAKYFSINEWTALAGSAASIPLTTDGQGWPTSDAKVLVSSNTLVAGTYKIVLDGEAQKIWVPSGNITNLLYNAATNKTSADWNISSPVSGNIWLDISGTRRKQSDALGTGFTNLHIWRPNLPSNGSVMFTPEFLTAMRKFQVIRAMEFTGVNQSAVQTWAERSLMSWAGTRSKDVPYQGSSVAYNFSNATMTTGQPWELLVQLANAANVDLWINIPVRVNDDYLLKLAQLIRYGSDGVNPYTSVQTNPVWAGLNANLNVYVEYGNELWNSGAGFYGYYYAMDLAKAAATDPNHPINYDGLVSSDIIAKDRFMAYRSSKASLTFRKVFGDAAMMTRVRPVLGSQLSNPAGSLRTALQWAEGFYSKIRANNTLTRRVNSLWYGGGGAAYYSSTLEPLDAFANSMTDYFNGLPNSSFAQEVRTNAIWTKAYGLQTIAYEGGPQPGGIATGGHTALSLEDTLAYNADARMTDRMIAAHNIWSTNGGDLFVYYVYQGSPPWNFSVANTGVSSTNTPKLQAIDILKTATKASVTVGTLLPATIAAFDTTSTNAIGTGWSILSNPLLQTQRLFADNMGNSANASAIIFPVRATSARTYFVQLKGAISTTQGATSYNTAKIELLVNGVSKGTWSPAPVAAINANTVNAITPNKISVTLPVGLSVITVRVISKQYDLKALVIN